MKKPIITFNNFSFQYHSQSEPTLKGIQLTIYEGEKVLIVGPSGSGKSTLAQCINGLIPNIYEGEIQGTATVAGKNIQETSLFDLSFDVGTVLQDTDGQFIGLTVAEDIAFALENDAVVQAEMKKAVHKWSEIVELNQLLQHRPQDLSGGQKQRVSMAGVLINQSKILLFDEPLANLDPRTGQETMTLIDTIQQETKATVLIIEHRLEDVLCESVDRIIVMNEGAIISDTTPDELLRQDTLTQQGIREPLYVTAMKYAGIDLTQVSHLDKLAEVSGETVLPKMTQWSVQPSSVSAVKGAELLRLEQVSYQYDRHGEKVLDDFSITIHHGEMISIVGKNGAGKSTLSKIICGFITPQSGKILWEGQDFSNYSIKERAEKIGYVMQNPNQMISKKMIFDEVALGLVLRDVPQAEIEERVTNILHICGLYPFRNWPISALSFGQKKRVTIASILVLEPELLILDEPTAGQDFKHYTEMMTFLEELNRLGVTILMITHDMHLMLEYTTRALVVCDGRLLADATPVAVLTNEKLIQAASLKETSLFTFAKALGLENPLLFTEKFVAYDREVRFG
ncbi:ABC transporter ATP-binding protein [Enterococcus faecalis]|uniref:ABC transporter ATP-binding protein n=1 Tax=Enterococcus faecalis TaxID=1351 RepID=UPI000DE8F0F3|nr:ABC transporter ATP-binding protein [Enterococcus faecalis]EGO8274983.1 ABC transporter ATP-binding protein [Enterococcus faecalis]EGO9001366.1 ATP-binding cassette domain-containing protein [Enterococcus faecalis]NSW10662.1 ABC transporter ATP-binding protein [Enterococcus faecalis]RBR48185.1 ABC transporter ATP-binding protein [Enterococcus faecalis]TQB29968.1 ABC transporter ATP-binding protein [Enterococcus faecalis]